MGVAAAEGEQPDPARVSAPGPVAHAPGAVAGAGAESGGGDPVGARVGAPLPTGGASLPSGADPPLPADGVSGPPAAHPQEFTLEGLLLLDSDDNETVAIEALSFSDNGIGVVKAHGEQPRVLPWSSVITHVVEPWSGGVIPEWWVDPELNRRGASVNPVNSVTDPGATNRPRADREPGALIGIQTPTQTYRFLLPGGDAREISRQVASFAVRFQGPTGASSVTRVVRWGQDAERRRVARPAKRDFSWAKVQPFLVVALIVFLATAVTIILLQSAGAIHLPYLGGVGSGVVAGFRTG